MRRLATAANWICPATECKSPPAEHHSCTDAGAFVNRNNMSPVRILLLFALLTITRFSQGERPSAAPFRLPVTGEAAMSPAGPDDLPSWLQDNDVFEPPFSVEPESSVTDSPIAQAIANVDPQQPSLVTSIPSFVSQQRSSNRVVRYEIPLTETDVHDQFSSLGIPGQLISVESKSPDDRSSSERWLGFFSPESRRREAETIQVVRYDVPAEEIQFHAQMQSPVGRGLSGEIISAGFLPIPEVRFFQPKARVFMDLKRDNEDEFDLFDDGAILASLDVIELHFPMPLISDRFGELLGTPSQLSQLGWRVGGTVGLGIATALNNGSDNGRAPVTTLSSGIRYEFPLGRPSREVLETGDLRLDQRTRVGIEWGVQAGVSTRESLDEKTDVGMYFGFQIDTPWGG